MNTQNRKGCVPKREWRLQVEADKQRKCYARSPYEKRPFYVEWNSDYRCWGIAGSPHILVVVTEILSAKPIPLPELPEKSVGKIEAKECS